MQVNVSSQVFGVGSIETSSASASPVVKKELDQNLAILNDVINRSYTNPESLTTADFNEVVKSLINIKQIMTDGIKDDQGLNLRVTEKQANALVKVFDELAKFGITPDAALLSLGDNDKIALLTQIGSTGKLEDSAIIGSLSKVATTTGTDNINSAMYSMMFDEVFPTTSAQFDELASAMELTEQVIKNLNVIRDASTQTTTIPSWGFTESDAADLASSKPSSGSIPPESVDDLYKYIKKVSDKETADKFRDAYEEDYNDARAVIINQNPGNRELADDPATIKAEMQRKNPDGSPVYGKGAKVLHDVIFKKDSPQRITEMLDIIQKSQVTEVKTKPNTTSQTGADLREAMINIGGTDGKGGIIGELRAQGADEELIKSLETLYKDLSAIDKSIDKTGKTQEQVDLEFAESWITHYSEPSKVPGERSNQLDLENAMTQFSNLNTDQQQELKSMMTYLDMLMKQVTAIMKSLDDAIKKISSNIRT